jgi:dTDP-4-dehydrorhamnose reductase
MNKILVTGANGQVGMELRQISSDANSLKYIFYNSSEWDITDEDQCKRILLEESPQILINLAAYTKVDLAEKEPELCFRVNSKAPQFLAALSNAHGIKMIHISSDYVFHALQGPPIDTKQTLNPAGVYAHSKARAESFVLESNPSAIIVRSSWIYSSFGHNFVKTMIALSKSHSEIKVVNDQIGSPTYAGDLANFLNTLCLKLAINKDYTYPNVLHYANRGAVSWFDFAKKIFELIQQNTRVIPISTEEFNAPAPRPRYSVLDCSETEHIFNIRIPEWQDSLKSCISKMNF